MAGTYRSVRYSDAWVEEAFLIWYKAGKPDASLLSDLLTRPPEGIIPDNKQLNTLIKTNFVPRALELDSEVAELVEKELIQDKVEMFRRHTEIAVELQDQALQYLRTEGIKDSSTAIKALLSAVELEKQSRGIDKVLQNVGTRTDEQLMDELRKLVSGASSVTFLPTGEESSDASE